MRTFSYFLNSLQITLLLFAIAATLLNTEYFYNTTTTAYYGFCIIALLFTVIPPHLYLCKNKIVTLKTPIVLFGLWCLYVLTHYFTHTGTLGFTIYSIALYFFLLKTTAVFSSPNFNFNLLFCGIAAIASLESIYCIAQFFGCFKSQNELFAVTGSWNNPNVIAIFLSLTTPVFLFLFKGKHKKTAFFGFAALLLALLLLKCRAALIGTVLSSTIFYGLEYQFINWVKNKKNRTTAKTLLILSLIIIIPAGSHLYNAKRASADGRKFIWKLSAMMASEKPATGYGYGHFEKEYNLYQADYIKNGKATSQELANVGPVIMPHNELLQNAVEGGGIGLLFISLFFGSLLFTIKQKKETNQNEPTTELVKITKNSNFNLSYAGIGAFIGISMVNSTIQIIPIMCLLIIYVAIICSTLESIKYSLTFCFLNAKPFSSLNKILIGSTSLFLLYLLIGMASADNLNKKALLLKKEKKYELALKIMPNLAKNINSYSDYWKNYGIIHLEMQQYAKALYCLEKAKKRSSLPELYHASGLCYEKLHQYPQAIIEYETLVALHPSKFIYRMILLKTYLKNSNTTKAVALAQEIIQMKPKIQSQKVNRYKKICKILLQDLIVLQTNKT